MEETDLPPKVSKRLCKNVNEGGKLKVLVHNSTYFEVQRKSRPLEWRVVDLDAPSCTCGFFDEFGIPCRHLCAASIRIGVHPKNLVMSQLHVRFLKETYSGHIVPVDMNGLESDGTKAPIKTRKRGRPKEKRFPSPIENTRKRTVVCGKCHQPGHNTRSCKVVEERDE